MKEEKAFHLEEVYGARKFGRFILRITFPILKACEVISLRKTKDFLLTVAFGVTK